VVCVITASLTAVRPAIYRAPDPPEVLAPIGLHDHVFVGLERDLASITVVFGADTPEHDLSDLERCPASACRGTGTRDRARCGVGRDRPTASAAPLSDGARRRPASVASASAVRLTAVFSHPLRAPPRRPWRSTSRGETRRVVRHRASRGQRNSSRWPPSEPAPRPRGRGGRRPEAPPPTRR